MVSHTSTLNISMVFLHIEKCRTGLPFDTSILAVNPKDQNFALPSQHTNVLRVSKVGRSQRIKVQHTRPAVERLYDHQPGVYVKSLASPNAPRPSVPRGTDGQSISAWPLISRFSRAVRLPYIYRPKTPRASPLHHTHTHPQSARHRAQQ